MTEGTSTTDRAAVASGAGGALLKRGAAIFLPAGGALTLSRLLQQLSGRALWVPEEYRAAVEVFTTLLGTITFLVVFNRPDGVRLRTSAASRAPQTTKLRHRGLQRALLFAVAAVVLFIPYMWLRAQCVISWDAREWKEANLGPDSTVDTSDMREFVDIEHGQVYVPLLRPREDQDYIDAVGRSNRNGTGGLQWILQEEPDRLFDWERDRWKTDRMITSTMFLLLHLGIVACVAAAVAYAGGLLGAEARPEGAGTGSGG